MSEERNESMVNVAFECLKKHGKSIAFSTLYDKVCKQLNYTDAEKTENIAVFYTNLTLDGRFSCLEKNVWDLRDNLSLDQINAEALDALNNEEDVEDKVNREESDEELDEDIEELEKSDSKGEDEEDNSESHKE